MEQAEAMEQAETCQVGMFGAESTVEYAGLAQRYVPAIVWQVGEPMRQGV